MRGENPPGFGTADATTYGYDGFNRRTSTTGPNDIETVTTYDSLNRSTQVRQKGATAPEDLVTTYTYNVFGDLFCTKLPRGKGIEYLYDGAGRLKEIRRGTVVATPDSTTCLDSGQPRERTVYQFDGQGHRAEESLERWTGAAWEGRSKTAYEYTCHLDKMTQGSGSPIPSVTEYCYDLNDNLEKVWDANHPKALNPNPTQLYAYDTLNRLTSTTVGPGTAGAAATAYTYDLQDHLGTVTDAEGNLTTYTSSDRDLAHPADLAGVGHDELHLRRARRARDHDRRSLDCDHAHGGRARSGDLCHLLGRNARNRLCLRCGSIRKRRVSSLRSTRASALGVIRHHWRGWFNEGPPPQDTARDFNLIHFRITCPCPQAVDAAHITFISADGSPFPQFTWSWALEPSTLYVDVSVSSTWVYTHDFNRLARSLQLCYDCK